MSLAFSQPPKQRSATLYMKLPDFGGRAREDEYDGSEYEPYRWPGFLQLTIGLLAPACLLAAAAYNHHEWLVATGVIALTSLAAGTAYIVVEHRRVRRIEARWIADHPTGHSHRHVA
jgi:hypothetical protein